MNPQLKCFYNLDKISQNNLNFVLLVSHRLPYFNLKQNLIKKLNTFVF